MFYLSFFLPLLLFSAYGESAPVYDAPYSPIFTDKSVYSWTDKIKITIVSPSWNADKFSIDSIGNLDSHPIKVSTSEHSLKSYKLTETDVNSGIFTGEVILTGFAHDADGDGDVDTIPKTTGHGPTNGFLESERDSAVTISFEFADGLVLTESVPVSWNLGTIRFFLDESVVVRVIDFDMNLNPEMLDVIPIHLFSNSDIAGIEVNAVETSESSGSFIATISTSQKSPSSGNRLYVLPGDEIFVKYEDHTLPKPFSHNDHLEINSLAKVDSSIPYVERLSILQPTFSDGVGDGLELISSDSQIQIVGSVKNNHELKQKFVYLFQVKTHDNYVESISWIQGDLLSYQELDVSRSWIPKLPGKYIVETFVWNSIEDPNALSDWTSVVVSVE